MNRLAIVAVLAFSWISGSAQCVRDDIRISQLRGVVVEHNSGNPIARASISVKTSDPDDIKPVAEWKTDASGKFDLLNLRPGKYTLSIRAEDFLDPIITRLTITRSQRKDEFLRVELAPTNLSGTDSCEGHTEVINRRN